jgi:hypothetical protein
VIGRFRLALTACLAATTGGCSVFTSYPSRTSGQLRAFEQGRFAESATAYAEEASGGDELLYRFEEGMAYQSGGFFDKSKTAFEQAETVIDGFDARPNISGRDVAEGVGAAFLNDKAMPYEGANYERVLVNTFQSINYWMLGDVPGALVEVRRALIVKRDGDRDPPPKGSPPENVFSQYLSGILRELNGDLDNAYVDYRQVHERDPGFIPATRDLLRIAEATGRGEDADRWRSELGNIPASRSIATNRDPNEMELVVIACVGLAPVKDSFNLPLPTGHSVTKISIPKYVERPDPGSAVRILVDGVEVGRTAMVENVAAVAMAQLERKMPWLVAKTFARATGRAIGTEVVYDALRKSSEGGATAWAIGAALWNLFIEQADLRSWLTLPRLFEVGRVVVKPGLREVRLELLGSGGNLLAACSLGKLELRPRSAVPLYARSIGPTLHAYAGADAIPPTAAPSPEGAPASEPRK